MYFNKSLAVLQSYFTNLDYSCKIDYIIMPKISPTLRLWVVSISAILFITIGTALLVAYGQGYSFDINARQLRSSGLVLIDSDPSGAKIKLSGKATEKQTPYRYTNASAGNLQIELQKNGYRAWQAIETVVNGTVTFSNYALLLPEVLSQQNIDQGQPYSAIIQSEDKQKTVGLTKSKLELYVVSDKSESKLIYQPPPASVPSKSVVELANLVMSRDGSSVLFQQKLANGEVQSLVVQTNNGQIDNLSTEFGFAFSDLRFNQNDSNELFWLEAGVLKKIKINEHIISSNLISDIASLSVQKDRLLVVSTTVASDTSQKLLSYDLAGNDKRELSSLKPDPMGYQTSFIHSRYSEYITVIYNTTKELELIKNPYFNQSVRSEGSGVNALIASPNGRLLVISQDNRLRTIDLEFDQEYSFGTNLTGLGDWRWYDDYHLLLLQNNQLRLVDFDGQNDQLLTPIADVVGFSLHPSDKYIVPLNSTGNIFKLWLIKK